jgi:Domain of unknown function (DUF927)
MSTHAGLVHYANAEDESTGEAFDIFKFNKVGGRRGTLPIEREIADDPLKVCLRLRKFNANLSQNPDESRKEVSAAISAPPRHFLRYSASYGWRADSTAFATAGEVIDTKNRGRKLLPPRSPNGVRPPSESDEGSLPDWKATVPRICGGSDLAMMLLSAAFAAPLLKITGWSSFGLNIHSLAKDGKSVALLAASSVAGAGRESGLPNWADTKAALGEQCRLHCDRLMPINEVGLIAKSSAYDQIRLLIYAIAEGRERDRHSKSQFAVSRGSSEYRTIFVSTAEHPFDDYAARASETRDAGEHARCTDVSATREGRPTVIDRFPASVAPSEREACARRSLARLRSECERNHGVALRPYVEFLMKDYGESERRIRHYMKWFARKLHKSGTSGAVQHAIGNFSLIFAGGCMAVDAGILDYKKRDLFHAIVRCLPTTIQSGERLDPLRTAKRTLRDRLNGDRIFRATKEGAPVDVSRFDGYRRVDRGRRKFVIHSRKFRSWFADPSAVEGIIEWLNRIGCLKLRQSRSTNVRERTTDLAVRHVKWPDGKLTRSIVFDDPFDRRA